MANEDFYNAGMHYGFIGQFLAPIYIIPGLGIAINYFIRRNTTDTEMDWGNDLAAYIIFLISLPVVIGPAIFGLYCYQKR